MTQSASQATQETKARKKWEPKLYATQPAPPPHPVQELHEVQSVKNDRCSCSKVRVCYLGRVEVWKLRVTSVDLCVMEGRVVLKIDNNVVMVQETWMVCEE